MNKEVLFSIIVPIYQGEPYIKRCLNSLLSQTYSNWEAILVDNYSQDATEEIVSSFDDDRIHYYKFHNNGVIAASRNFGVTKSRGGWLCFLDVDDWWTKDKLEKVLLYVNDYSFLYHHQFLHYDDGKTTFKAKLSRSFPVKGKGIESVKYMLTRGNPIQTSTVCINKKIFKEFDESPKLVGVEDFDLWLRIFHTGIKSLLIDEPLGYYNVGSTYSRNYTQIVRERYLLTKWLPALTENERRQVLFVFSFHCGNLYYINREYKKARLKWRISLLASSFHVKWMSFVGILKSFVRR